MEQMKHTKIPTIVLLPDWDAQMELVEMLNKIDIILQANHVYAHQDIYIRANLMDNKRLYRKKHVTLESRPILLPVCGLVKTS